MATDAKMGGTEGGLPHGHATSDVGPIFEPVFKRVEGLVEVPLAPGVSAQFLAGGRMMFSFVRLAPGGVVADHAHPNEQMGYILEGSILLTVDGKEHDLRVGDAYAIPGGVTHRGVGGPEGCLALDVFSPPREDYLARAVAMGQGDD